MPGFWSQEAGTTAYTATGAQDKLDAANEQYQSARDGAFERIEEDTPELSQLRPLGSNEGPEQPYPLSFSAKVVKGRGEDKRDTGAATANLKAVPEDIKAKLNGVYFGWVSLSVPSEKTLPAMPDALKGWKEALITVAPSAKAIPTVAPNKEFKVYIIQDFGDLTFFGARMKVMALGYLHPFKPFDPERSSMELYKDITVAQLSLARPGWKAEAVEDQVKLAKKGRSLTDHFVNARQFGQKQVDKIPLHMLGVRTDSLGVRDRWAGNGGFSIPR